MRVRAALIFTIVALFSFLSRHAVVDDGLIYARVLQNALVGNGLVFNVGEHVNALTSPLFTYLLLAASWLLRGNILLAEHLLFAAALIATCLLADRRIPWSGVAVASTAYFYMLIGLESTVFLFTLMLVATVYEAGRYEWLPTLLVLTSLTRFEGGLLIPIAAFYLWRQRKFPRITAYLPAAAILLAYLLINHHWYSAYLPTSASSKIGQGRSGYWGPWPSAFLRVQGWAFVGSGSAFHSTLYVVPLTVIFGFLGWRLLRPNRFNDLIAPFWLGLALFYLLFNIPGYHWYWAPLIFFAILYAVKGVPKSTLGLRTMVAVIALAGVTNLSVVRSGGPVWDYVNISQWLNAHTPQAATVETAEIGTIGWYTHRTVIDVLGLTYPKNANHIAHRDVQSWLAEDRPDYIVVHRPLWVFEQVVATHPEYDEVPFHSGNIYILQREAAAPARTPASLPPIR